MTRDIHILDNEGVEFYPATVTDAVGHEQVKCSITKFLNKYNISSIWPRETAYTLAEAIGILNEKLSDEFKVPGVKAEFVDSYNRYEEWEFFGGGYTFDNILGWRETDSSVLAELQETVFPVTSNLTLSTPLIAVGESVNIDINWFVYRKGLDVTKSAIKLFNGTQTDETGTRITVNEPSHTSKTYTFTGTYQGLSSTTTKTLTVNDYCYRGIVAENWVPNAGVISSQFTKTLQSGRGYTWSGINLTNQRTCYAIPQYFGALTSIKDGNNFEYLGSYTRTNLTIESVDYYVYTLTKPTTISGFKQTFA